MTASWRRNRSLAAASARSPAGGLRGQRVGCAERAQHLPDGGQRRAAVVVGGAAGRVRHAEPARDGRRLGGEPGLADTRLAGDEHDLRGAAQRGADEPLGEPLPLALPPDEDRHALIVWAGRPTS